MIYSKLLNEYKVVANVNQVEADLASDTILDLIDLGTYQGGGTGRHWTLDPIDGTTNFVNSSTTHAVSVAALFRGESMAAAIWIPWPNEAGHLLIHARKGNGAWLNGSQMHVHPASDTGAPQAGVLAATPGWLRRMFNVGKPMIGNWGETRIGGSACFEQFMVAKGTMLGKK